MTHKVELVKDLMYKGCELHWHCVHCDKYIPVHCYSKEELENQCCGCHNVNCKDCEREHQ